MKSSALNNSYEFLTIQNFDLANKDACVDHTYSYLPIFKDIDGNTCDNLKVLGNCKDGKPVKGNVAMVGRMDAVYPAGGPADGISAVDACCVCGGGKKSEGNEEKQKAIGKSYS